MRTEKEITIQIGGIIKAASVIEGENALIVKERLIGSLAFAYWLLGKSDIESWKEARKQLIIGDKNDH